MASENDGQIDTTLCYRVVSGHFYLLVLNFEQHLPQLFSLARERGLISGEEATSNSLDYDRAQAIVGEILNKIETDQSWYNVLLTILREIPELDGVVKTLKETHTRERVGTSPRQSIPSRRSSMQSSHCRRYSDSDVSYTSVNCTHLPDQDSAIPESLEVSADPFPEEETGAYNGEQPKLTCAATDDGVTASSPVIPGIHASASEASTLAGRAMTLDTSSLPNSSPLELSQPPPPPIERVSSDEATPGPIQCRENGTIERLHNLRTENQYLKSETEILEEKITKLEEKQAKLNKKIEEQGAVVSKKDEIITQLRKDCDSKDGAIAELKRDKAKLEKSMDQLKKEHERDKEKVRESYRSEIDQLQKNIEEIEAREQQALIELERAKRELTQAELEKEREIFKLKEEYYELRLNMNKLEEEKKRENMAHEKNMALKEKELAEEKERSAQEAAKRERELRRKIELELEELKKRKED